MGRGGDRVDKMSHLGMFVNNILRYFAEVDLKGHKNLIFVTVKTPYIKPQYSSIRSIYFTLNVRYVKTE